MGVCGWRTYVLEFVDFGLWNALLARMISALPENRSSELWCLYSEGESWGCYPRYGRGCCFESADGGEANAATDCVLEHFCRS